jgi:hypothetical protein
VEAEAVPITAELTPLHFVVNAAGFAAAAESIQEYLRDSYSSEILGCDVPSPATSVVGPALSAARTDHVAAVLGGSVFVAGGTTGGTPVNLVEMITPTNVQSGWEITEPMPVALAQAGSAVNGTEW